MAAAAEILQHVKSEVEFNLPRSLRIAATEHGKSPWAQVREIWRLRFGPGKLRPDEYYYYGLYERRFGLEDQLRFLGRAAQDGIYRACNALEWWLIAHESWSSMGSCGARACRCRRPARSTTAAAASGRGGTGIPGGACGPSPRRPDLSLLRQARDRYPERRRGRVRGL
jgi:hypothetical protein